MNKYANNYIQKMKPYNPPLENRKAYSGLLLDFNERTIPVDLRITNAVTEWASRGDAMLSYPEYGDVCEKMASYVGVKAEQVMMTNGTEEAIDLLFRTFTKHGDKVIIPSPSFALFYQCSQLNENEILTPEYDLNLEFPFEQVLDGIDERTPMIVICNPNNPTGTVVSLEDIEKILGRALKFDAMVFVDEAYFEFCGITAAVLIDTYPNLIVTRTFSKAFGLAGLRIGFAISQKPNIDEIMKVRGPYDVNMAGVIAANAALDDVSYVESYVAEVVSRSRPMVEEFFQESGVKFWPSGGNFLLFRPENSGAIYRLLNENGVRVRQRNDSTLRVTIGTKVQMEKFIGIYRNYLTK